jgi:sigma-B regulation protein RsbU (phosphoserine phosphatase)
LLLLILGLFPAASYQSGSAALAGGAVLTIFTDGVTEAFNDKDEEFGEERLIEALRASRRQSPEGIYRHVIESVRQWQGDLKQHDDITLIVAKVD